MNARFGYLAALAVLWGMLVSPLAAVARPGMGSVGGGGGRSFGGGGGGGARPSMPSRPSPNISRPSPNVSRPSFSGASRPSPNISRPSPGISRPSPGIGNSGNSRPSGPSLSGGIGGLHPSGTRPSLPSNKLPSVSNRPSITLPSTRPSIQLPGNSGGIGVRPSPGINQGDRPTTLPGIGSRPGVGDRPGIGTLPGIGDRPSIGIKPSPGDRPTTLPGIGTRPGLGERPGIGDRPGIGTLPGIGDRPTTLPGIGTRPGIGDRPQIGGQLPRPQRPSIGGGNHIGDNNININNWGISTLPGRYPGNNWNNNWNNNWHDHWHNNCIRPHYHNWYHGCWNGHWGPNYYAPIIWGSVGWRWGASWASSWGYGPSYYNPYYDPGSVTTVYNYSQPVVVQQYAASDDATGAAPAAAPTADPAVQAFDDGLALFKRGSYPQALSKFDGALRLAPQDPVIHEVRALTLFAMGRYSDAAATLNALLASAPGMDWTSLSSLYGDTADYTAQLRKLETYVKANPTDTAAMFTLSYQYLVIGENDAAIRGLREVVKQQPKDATAQKLLAALAPAPEPAPQPAPAPAANAPSEPTTDLVGTWLAKGPDVAIKLMIDADSNFTWTATPTGKPAVELKGVLSSSADQITLESKDQGAMTGKVKSGGQDKFTFFMQGMPAGEPGLSFQRAP